jgi:hypothetical protein
VLLNEGDKVLVAHRRLFAGDTMRFFVGRVDAYENGLIKVTGETYVRDPMQGGVSEKAEKRTKILSLSSGTLIVYQLPSDVRLESLNFLSAENHLVLSDGESFVMNLTETMHGGRI